MDELPRAFLPAGTKSKHYVGLPFQNVMAITKIAFRQKRVLLQTRNHALRSLRCPAVQ
jgi:hypothetical protein